MNNPNYDIVIVGAGAAGLTAAIGLARAGFAVAVVEAAAYPGAENWSGCVYFAENLAHAEILGADGVEALAWERRLVERGFFATDGQSILGMTYRDPEAFRHCYTVLRPVYDHHLGQIAVGLGVALLNETTAESLIREGQRIVGVCTQRGPLYAGLVFLAEGDASHLVTREGYERFTDPREAPKFLQGIKQVIDLPPGAVEEMFGVGVEEGVAYEMLVRNGTLNGKHVHLNMGGFVYTNRQSLSVGLVLPADNLNHHFDGDPNLLVEWFENLPVFRPWLKDGKRGVFGAKIIRGGGAKDIPTLIDEGLAIGGAASAIGIDFPYPNFTGPATGMGLLIVQAARRIRDERCGFTRDALRRHYLEPLQRTHYWQDVEFLRRWPAYVKRTRVFFDTQADLALRTAYVWTRPDRWFISKWTNWLRMVGHVAGPSRLQEIRHDMRHLTHALRMREVAYRPALSRLVVDGTVNALRDLFRRPRANLPAAGPLKIHYTVAGEGESHGLPPWLLRHWFRRVSPVLAAAAKRVYTNDDTPLVDKLPRVSRLLTRQVNLLDLLGIITLAIATGVMAIGMHFWDRVREWMSGRRIIQPLRGFYRRYVGEVQRVGDLTVTTTLAAQAWDARLGQLPYQTVKSSHIHIHWPRNLAEKNQIADKGLWHVCPAHVYEARPGASGNVQVIVNFENCIKCETCWRVAGDVVDWGRDGRHRFIYAVPSPVVSRVLDAAHTAGAARPAPPRITNWWEPVVKSIGTHSTEGCLAAIIEMRSLVEQLDCKLLEFDDALAEEPRTIDQARAEYLEMLARYAHQLAERMQEVVGKASRDEKMSDGIAAASKQLRDIVSTMVAKLHERTRRTWNQHYAWAAADGRQVRFHYLAGLKQILKAFDSLVTSAVPDPLQPWLLAESDAATVAERVDDWKTRLDAILPPGSWRALDRGEPLASESDATLRDIIAGIPTIDAKDLRRTLHPPLRKALLAELGRRDSSLAYRVASHLWARDMVHLAAGSAAWTQLGERLARAEEWACFAVVPDAVPIADKAWEGDVLFVPVRSAARIILLLPNQLIGVSTDHKDILVEPLDTLGLRGSGLARVILRGLGVPDTSVNVDHERILRIWQVLSAADLIAIASGMAEVLCRRALDHATGRVQFPGLFHDEMARDAIGKFGAIKRMIAEIAAGQYLIETVSHDLSPSDFSATTAERAGLLKALIAEVLGTSPGSISYNAGQVFGGTAFSEDDILAKYYRDSAAWRFLGVPNTEIYRWHGSDLLRNWRADGQSLANVAQEAEIFEQLVQRKALQGELDEIRNARSRIRGLVVDWLDTDAGNGRPGSVSRDRLGAAEVAESLARQNAHLLASKALVLRTHARLETGHSSETEIALLRVWLERAATSLTEFEGAVRHWRDAAARSDDRPLMDPNAGPPVVRYHDYLRSDSAYDSGDFLVKPVDLLQPRFIADMIQSDPELSRKDREIRDLLAKQFGLREGGIPYERYIERQHRPDEADLDFCRKHGFFRMTIAKELGGEGRPKVDYYLVASNTQRMVDVGISLSIQVNTGLGTTPVYLGRCKDLPKAQKEVGAFVGNSELHARIDGTMEALRKNPSQRNIETLQKLIDERITPHTALKASASRLRKACAKAAEHIAQRAPKADLQKHVLTIITAWRNLTQFATDLQGELARRIEAGDLFLRWVSQGQISAFALTEPSAGSDTARVATRAKLRSAPVEAEREHFYRFIPVEGNAPRILLDARRLEFRGNQVLYRWSDHAEPAPIRFDEYDYETDDPRRMRYVAVGDAKVYFTDIGQLRERDGKQWYDYWELTGAKMWITNGRMMGIMCLYAKTDEGVTGFIVDRHAEGLIVGKDEDKLGQCGSPTNELALQSVRVPRENVMGLEGRGQVNALETLNVGRAGLGMSAMAQMEALIEWSRLFARKEHNGEPPAWVQWRLQRMEEIRFTSEALAHEVIGRFEHPQTKSVRLESAIAKMLVSELLHQVIELAEEIHGIAGQTQRHLVEKRKRDARVLTIYEGTNEIQRFFILRDLATEVAPRWLEAPAAPAHLSREALELEVMKGALRQRLQSALGVFGGTLAQNPNLQANCFILAEAAAWLKAADSTLARLAWLARLSWANEDEESLPKTDLGRSAFARALWEVKHRLLRFDEELTYLRRGFYAPEVRAANLLFERPAQSTTARPFASRIDRPLSIWVILDSLVPESPQPHIGNGRLLEPHRVFSEADRSALETALRLKDQAREKVAITAIAVGNRASSTPLRELLSLGVDRVRLVVSENEAVTPDGAAAALSVAFVDAKPDLILGGGGDGGNQEGLVARLAAEGLGVPFAGIADRVAVQTNDAAVVLADAEGGDRRTRALPAAVGMKAGLSLRAFSIDGYLAGLSKTVEIVRWPGKVAARVEHFEEKTHAERQPVGDDTPRSLSPRDAAQRLLSELGLAGSTNTCEPFGGSIENVQHPSFLDATPAGIIAVLAAEPDGRLAQTTESVLATARLTASAWDSAFMVLLLVPTNEEIQRIALAHLASFGAGDVVLLTLPHDGAEEVRCRLLSQSWPELSTPPLAVVGEPWCESAFAALVVQRKKSGTLALRIRGLERKDRKLIARGARAAGKLIVRQTLGKPAGHDATAWISLATGAEVESSGAAASPSLRVQRWSPRLERFYAQNDIQQLLAELKQETGLERLTDADFIVDVGYGIGNQDGYETVIEPLIRILQEMGVRHAVGGSRKVTEELHLLAADRQIGQSGVSVNPQILLTIGVSGAPQHLNYIGPRATILAFNRDPEAPLMTLNQRQPRPRVFPIVGDLFTTVPAFTAALRDDARQPAGVSMTDPDR